MVVNDEGKFPQVDLCMLMGKYAGNVKRKFCGNNLTHICYCN